MEIIFYHLNANIFQNILFSIGSAFLYYVNHFKLYSSFCASHSKAQKVLHPSKLNGIYFLFYFFIIFLLFPYYEPIFTRMFSDEGNQALQEFLVSCNPRQQHSTALESYLIKPIQRILKYPLLLTQLKVQNIKKTCVLFIIYHCPVAELNRSKLG